MSLKMTLDERESFLADVHVGIISIEDRGRGPLAAPIWYAYEPGGTVAIVTQEKSRKGRLLRRVERFSLCAQTEQPPYKYVNVEGPIVSIEPADDGLREGVFGRVASGRRLTAAELPVRRDFLR